MKKADLRELLQHQFPSQTGKIEGVLKQFSGDEIPDPAAILNEFRNREPSLLYSPQRYAAVKTRRH